MKKGERKTSEEGMEKLIVEEKEWWS